MNLWRIALAVALAFLVWAMLTPSPPPAGGISDKVQHVAVFAALAVLAAFSFPTVPRWRLALALVAAGGLLELAQAFTGRQPEALDLGADALGCVAAWLVPRRAPRESQ